MYKFKFYLAAVGLIFFFAAAASAVIPASQKINLQGKLTPAPSSSPVNMKFEIGTWSETASIVVDTSTGIFNAEIGGATPITPTVFNSAGVVQVKIYYPAGAATPIVTQNLNFVPYAFRAAEAESASAYLPLAGGTMTGTLVLPDAYRNSQTPANKYLVQSEVDTMVNAETAARITGDAALNAAIASQGTSATGNFVNVTGDTMTGPLTIEGATAPLHFKSTDAGGRHFIVGSATSPSKGLHFWDLTANLGRMVISDSGNVGIGTATPSQKLHVDGGGLFKGLVTAPLLLSDRLIVSSVSALETVLTHLLTAESSTGAAISGITATDMTAAYIAGVTGMGTNARGLGVKGVGGSGDSSIGVYGTAPSGAGVQGDSSSGAGVVGSSPTGMGVFGSSSSNYGVKGTTAGGAYSGIYGENTATSGDRTAVYGHSTDGKGIYGRSEAGRGVQGWSSSGTGVYASSSTGYGVYSSAPNNYFSGKLFVSDVLSTEARARIGTGAPDPGGDGLGVAGALEVLGGAAIGSSDNAQRFKVKTGTATVTYRSGWQTIISGIGNNTVLGVSAVRHKQNTDPANQWRSVLPSEIRINEGTVQVYTMDATGSVAYDHDIRVIVFYAP